MYEYKALVTDVYDGDTITVTIDLGFGVSLKKQKIRLLGIDAPEINSEDKVIALVVRNWLRDKLLDKEVKIQTVKDSKEKYGRFLGTVYLDEQNINELLMTTFPEVVSF